MNHNIILISTALILGLAQALPAADVRTVDSPASLADAIRKSGPGDIILIRDGKYQGWTCDIDAVGAREAPVIIRPASPGGVVFSGKNEITVSGEYVHLEGLVFKDCTLDGRTLLSFVGSGFCQASGILFENCTGNRPIVQFEGGAHDNTISDCSFTGIATRSVHVQVNEKIHENGVPERNVIRNNLFMDIPPLGENGRETVKIGQNQPEFGHIKTYTLVEDNLFIRANGEAEIISNKASCNTFRGNTFMDCEGELVMRGGHDCLIENNHFFDCSGGIRLSGTGHIVRSNIIIGSKGTGIRLLYGMSRDQGGHYQAASGCEIRNNTIINPGRMGISIGEGRGNDGGEKGIQQYPPENNSFTGNLIISKTGRFLHADHAPDNTLSGNRFIED